ncbi:ArsR/SmtB family transcription factor [Pyrobaculum neutrophilum]|uniref:Transcriptional regulator, ArsR family n=1 Tax=Pyrobaculum neutrophilum (strain DSM 2338 / JCM 9278 / NBRC 100436 / V24Sta) TaxID=444157 RepID=B1YBJ8_PYRNV|nr:winged helix-turn-helix domain-containing protein [Pyrobaculum neutrophilum]ACB40800.1 transcriptional regulator, ArsR family [Pyrobaculum neutrophilum V24Sta]
MIDLVLGSPTRIKIVMALWLFGEMNMSELARRVGATQEAVSEQLEQLVKYGVVEVKYVGRVRLYKLSSDPAIRRLAEAFVEAEGALAASGPQ